MIDIEKPAPKDIEFKGDVNLRREKIEYALNIVDGMIDRFSEYEDRQRDVDDLTKLKAYLEGELKLLATRN